MIRKFMTLLTAAFLALTIQACFNGADEHNHDDHDHGTQYTSAEGHFTVVPDFSPEDAVAATAISVKLPILDHHSEFASGAEVIVKPWMTMMNHGTEVDPNVMEMSDHYHVTDIQYSMDGMWDLKIYITHEAVVDSFSVPVTVSAP